MQLQVAVITWVGEGETQSQGWKIPVVEWKLLKGKFKVLYGIREKGKFWLRTELWDTVFALNPSIVVNSWSAAANCTNNLVLVWHGSNNVSEGKMVLIKLAIHKADRRTECQVDWQTNRQKDVQYQWIDRITGWLTSRQTDWLTDLLTDRQAYNSRYSYILMN